MEFLDGLDVVGEMKRVSDSRLREKYFQANLPLAWRFTGSRKGPGTADSSLFQAPLMRFYNCAERPRDGAPFSSLSESGYTNDASLTLLIYQCPMFKTVVLERYAALVTDN